MFILIPGETLKMVFVVIWELFFVMEFRSGVIQERERESSPRKLPFTGPEKMRKKMEKKNEKTKIGVISHRIRTPGCRSSKSFLFSILPTITTFAMGRQYAIT